MSWNSKLINQMASLQLEWVILLNNEKISNLFIHSLSKQGSTIRMMKKVLKFYKIISCNIRHSFYSKSYYTTQQYQIDPYSIPCMPSLKQSEVENIQKVVIVSKERHVYEDGGPIMSPFILVSTHLGHRCKMKKRSQNQNLLTLETDNMSIMAPDP